VTVPYVTQYDFLFEDRRSKFIQPGCHQSRPLQADLSRSDQDICELVHSSETRCATKGRLWSVPGPYHTPENRQVISEHRDDHVDGDGDQQFDWKS
jgi:hypothetical protein